MDPFYLHVDELDFELASRGYPLIGNAQQKKTIVRELLQSEKELGTNYKKVQLDRVLEMQNCIIKLGELRNAIENRLTHSVYESRRMNSLLHHLDDRISHLLSLPSEQVAEINKLKEELGELKQVLIAGYTEVNSIDENLTALNDQNIVLNEPSRNNQSTQTIPTNTEIPSLLDMSRQELPQGLGNVTHRIESWGNRRVSFAEEPRIDSPSIPESFREPFNSTRYLLDNLVRQQSSVPVYDTSVLNQPLTEVTHQDQTEPIIDLISFNEPSHQIRQPRIEGISSQTSPYPFPTVQTTAVHRWNVHFTGDPNTLCGFLERVEELQVARGITKEQLLRSALDLFKDKALIWYRSIKTYIRTWDELVAQLKTDFLPFNYNEQLWEEIKARKQGKDERITIYLAVMENLFGRLTKHPTLEMKLQVIMRNLQPKFSQRMTFINIKTLEELKTACRLIEQSELQSVNFKQAPTLMESELLEPELLYKPKVEMNRGYSRPKAHNVAELAINRKVECWNCQEEGHGFNECKKKRTVFCYRCGRREVTVQTCPKCKTIDLRQDKPKERIFPRSRATTSVGKVSDPATGAISRTPKEEWEGWLLKVRKFCKPPETAPLFTQIPYSNRPFTSVTIGGHHLLALIDSGSEITIIGAPGLHLVNSLNLKLMPVNQKFVTTADGTTQPIKGQVLIPLTVNNQTKTLPAWIIPSICHALILGADFCHLFSINMNFASKTWETANVNSEAESIEQVRDVSTLSAEQLNQLNQVIGLFCKLSGLGKTHLIEHKIDTGNAEPVKQRYFPISPAMQVHLYKELERMLALGVVRESNSPWNSPVLLVAKSNGDYRLCFDGRKLNSVTKRDAYPLPYVSDILNKLRDAKYLTSIDLKSAFWQIPLEESSREKCAFTVPGKGLFEFTRMPFGLNNSAQTQQRLMDKIFPETLQPNVFTYLDDIIIVTKTFEDHLRILRDVYDRLKRAGLTINIDKCHFCRPSLQYLGYVVDKHGLRTSPEKISAIQNFPKPMNVTELKRFMGVCSWYRRFIPFFSSLVAPLNDLQKGKKKRQSLNWTKEAEEAFAEIKEKLTKAPVLAAPDYSKPFIIQTDASDRGIGGVLVQGEGENEHPIAFVSRSLNRCERNYSVTERECLAVVFSIEKFRPYVEGTTFKVLTDHYSLLWLQNIKEPTGRLARWSVRLQQYSFVLEHRKGKHNIVPDALSRAPLETSVVNVSMSDEWYQNMIAKVLEAPVNFPLWRVKDNQLFKLVPSRFSERSNLSDWKLVVPKENRGEIIQRCHDNPLSAHLGCFKTTQRILEYYYWPKMRIDIRTYIAKCEVCAGQKSPNVTKLGLMGKPKEVNFPFQLVSLDILGPLPRSRKGYTTLLVISDYFSKFVLILPMRKASAQKVAELVEQHLFHIFGVPQVILSDNGVQFTSQVFRNLVQRYNTRVWYTPRYHPQVNATERVNRVVITAIRSYIRNNHQDWDQHLSEIGSAIRSSVNEVTGYTPNYLVFGRHVPLSGDCYGDQADNLPIGDREPHIESLSQLKPLFDQVKTELSKAHKKNEKYYNLRRKNFEFLEGQHVWKRNFILSDASKNFSAKLAPKYIESIITRKLSPIVYELSDLKGNQLGKFHIKDLKPAVESMPSGDEYLN